MSKTVSIVSAGATDSLLAFAKTVLTKAAGVAVAAAPAATAGAVVVGAEAPQGAVAIVTKASAAAAVANSPYAGSKTVFVRAVLPGASKGDAALALKDAIDVLPTVGIASDAEAASALAAYKLAAGVAAAEAKASGAAKVTVLVKQATKYAVNNKLFAEATAEVFGAQGVAFDVAPSAAVANALVMFPETLGVVFTNDTPTGENVEGAFAGLVGGASRTVYLAAGGATASAGASHKSVALACAESLRALGLANEAAKIEKAAAAAKSGKDIAAAL